jgi:hypothetical protein
MIEFLLVLLTAGRSPRNLLLQGQFVQGDHVHRVLDGIFSHHFVNGNRPGLPNPMAPILGLLVVVRVEIDIVDDDRVGGRQINTQPASSSRKHKEENLVVGVERVDHGLPLRHGRLPVQPEIPIAFNSEVVLQNVHHLGELAKEQHTVAFTPQPRQTRVQLKEFARVEQHLVGKGAVRNARVDAAQLVDLVVGHLHQVQSYGLLSILFVSFVLEQFFGHRLDFVVRVVPSQQGWVVRSPANNNQNYF